MFVNFSNHPSSKWSTEQLEAAKKFGDIKDINFPAVKTTETSDSIKNLTKCYAEKILALKPDCVMCVGEFTLCYNVINILKENNITVVAAVSDRIVKNITDENGIEHKDVIFEFKGFREY